MKPNPMTPDLATLANVYGKQRRYRQRLVAQGKCPHCGKPCAPYYECGERRFYRQINYMLRRGIQAGRFKIWYDGDTMMIGMGDETKNVTSYARTKDDDRRLLPRFGKRPAETEDIIMEVFRRESRGLTEDEICTGIATIRQERRKP